jgi:RNA polymerase sigma-70 factor (ECF subfamily)
MVVDDAEMAAMLREAVAGNRLALQKLLLHYYPLIEATVRRGFHGDLAAKVQPEDVVQDALVDVWRGIGGFQGRDIGEFVEWLRRVAENCLADNARYFRRAKRGGQARHVPMVAPSDGESLDEIWDWLCHDSSPPDRPLRQEEVRQAIQVCLAQLNADQRDAVLALYFEHLDVAEIANRMGRSPGAIRELLRRTRVRLKKLLGSASAWLSSR